MTSLHIKAFLIHLYHTQTGENVFQQILRGFVNGKDYSEALGMTDNSKCHNYDCDYKSTLLLYLFIKIIVLTIDD